MIRFGCHSCGQKFEVSPKFGGKKSKCTKCGESLTIPQVVNEDSESIEQVAINLLQETAVGSAGNIDEEYELADDSSNSTVSQPGLVSPFNNASTGTSDWQSVRAERLINVTCPNCGNSSDYPESAGGGTTQCMNCGDPIYIPNLRQAQYALKKRKHAEKQYLLYAFLFSALIFAFLAYAFFVGPSSASRAEFEAKQFTRGLLNHPDSASLVEREIVESKPNGLFLVKVVWNAQNSFGVSGMVTCFVIVRVSSEGDATTIDAREDYVPSNWDSLK